MSWSLIYNAEPLTSIDHSELQPDSKQLAFSYKDILWSLFWLNKWKWKKQSCVDRVTNNQIYNDGLNELNSELDWVAIINSVRKLNALVESMIDDNSIHKFSQISTKPIKCSISVWESAKVQSKIRLKDNSKSDQFSDLQANL